jgi:carboxypeptidase family protein
MDVSRPGAGTRRPTVSARAISRRRISMRALPAALLCAFGAAAPLPAQETTTLAIHVVDPADAPITGARVELIGTRFAALSGDSGWVRLQGVPSGPALLRVTRIGYQPVRSTVQLPSGSPFEADVELAPSPIAVTGVTARGEPQIAGLALTGFYNRKAMGNGVFMGPEEIRRAHAHRMSDLFRHVSGLRLVPLANTGYALKATRTDMSLTTRRPPLAPRLGRPYDPTTDELCEMLTFFDGVPTVLESIDDVQLQTVGAVEVFRGPSEIPPVYNLTGSACGVVLMWSKTSDMKAAQRQAEHDEDARRTQAPQPQPQQSNHRR